MANPHPARCSRCRIVFQSWRVLRRTDKGAFCFYCLGKIKHKAQPPAAEGDSNAR